MTKKCGGAQKPESLGVWKVGGLKPSSLIEVYAYVAECVISSFWRSSPVGPPTSPTHNIRPTYLSCTRFCDKFYAITRQQGKWLRLIAGQEVSRSVHDSITELTTDLINPKSAEQWTIIIRWLVDWPFIGGLTFGTARMGLAGCTKCNISSINGHVPTLCYSMWQYNYLSTLKD